MRKVGVVRQLELDGPAGDLVDDLELRRGGGCSQTSSARPPPLTALHLPPSSVLKIICPGNSLSPLHQLLLRPSYPRRNAPQRTRSSPPRLASPPLRAPRPRRPFPPKQRTRLPCFRLVLRLLGSSQSRGRVILWSRVEVEKAIDEDALYSDEWRAIWSRRSCQHHRWENWSCLESDWGENERTRVLGVFWPAGKSCGLRCVPFSSTALTDSSECSVSQEDNSSQTKVRGKAGGSNSIGLPESCDDSGRDLVGPLKRERLKRNSRTAIELAIKLNPVKSAHGGQRACRQEQEEDEPKGVEEGTESFHDDEAGEGQLMCTRRRREKTYMQTVRVNQRANMATRKGTPAGPSISNAPSMVILRPQQIGRASCRERVS